MQWFTRFATLRQTRFVRNPRADNAIATEGANIGGDRRTNSRYRIKIEQKTERTRIVRAIQTLGALLTSSKKKTAYIIVQFIQVHCYSLRLHRLSKTET